MTKPTQERIERVAKAVYQYWMDEMPPHGIVETPYDEWGDKDYFRRCAKAALTALRRNPTAEDARLLYRYCSEGLFPHSKDSNGEDFTTQDTINWYGEAGELEITHAIDEQGNRVEVAIE